MSSNDVSVVLVHGAWADGSSWAKIIAPLAADGTKRVAAQLPLTSFEEDVAAVQRAIDRAPGQVVLAGHAYGGGVISAVRDERVKARIHSYAVDHTPIVTAPWAVLAVLRAAIVG